MQQRDILVTLPTRLAFLAAAAALLTYPVAGRSAHPLEVSDAEPEHSQARRDRFVKEIADYADAIGERPRGDILAAFRSVDRDRFVPDYQRPYALENRPLPIGNKQTISQPTVVAMMTHLLQPQEEDRVLEVGTGSGYQAAILSRLVDRVWSVEIVEDLARRSAETLAELGYDNVTVRHGDGYRGWAEEAPFDGIIVTAAAPEVPPPLFEQLAPGGRLVMPVGEVGAIQYLMVYEKNLHGEVQQLRSIPVRFVPLTRQVR